MPIYEKVFKVYNKDTTQTNRSDVFIFNLEHVFSQLGNNCVLNFVSNCIAFIEKLNMFLV